MTPKNIVVLWTNSRLVSTDEALAQHQSQSGEKHDGGAHGPQSPPTGSHRDSRVTVSQLHDESTYHSQWALFVSSFLSLPVWISNTGIIQSQIRKDDTVHYWRRAQLHILGCVCVNSAPGFCFIFCHSTILSIMTLCCHHYPDCPSVAGVYIVITSSLSY